MKKLLLGLGTIATVVTPVSAVVACGATTGGHIDPIEKAPEQAALDHMLEGSIQSHEAWALNSADIELAIENTRTNGIIKNLDFTTNPSAVIKDTDKPVFTKKITKAEIIAAEKNKQPSVFDEVSAEILDNIDGNKMYVGHVTETKTDSIPENGGEYEVNVYEKSQNLPLIQTAVDAFQDTTKFEFKEDLIKKIHGTYEYGVDHSFKIGGSKDIFSTTATVKGSTLLATNFHDRIEEDHLTSWTMFGAVAATKDATEATFTNDDKTIILPHAYYLKDRKSRKMNLVLKIAETQAGKVIDTQTLYIENDLLTSFSDTAWDAKEFKELFVKYLSSKPVYDFFIKLQSSAGSLDASKAPLKDLIMTISSKINLLAKTYKFANTTEFLDKFITYMSAEGVDMGNMLQGLKDYKGTTDDDLGFMFYGAKAWNGIQWCGEIIDKFSLFVEQEVKNGEYQLANIENEVALETLLAQQALKTKTVAEDKKYLDGHIPPISYDGLSVDDIIKLTDDTKAEDHKAAVAAMKATVSAFETKFTTTSDKESTERHPKWSPKAIALGKFIDDNAKTIFGDKWVNPGFSTLSNNGKFDDSFAKAANDGFFGYDMKNRGETKGFTMTSFVNDVIKKVLSSADFDKLQVTVLTPLGIVA